MAAVFWLTCWALIFSVFYGAADGHDGIPMELEPADDEGVMPNRDVVALLVSRQVDPCLLPSRLRPPSCMRQYGRYYKRMPQATTVAGKLREAAAGKQVRMRTQQPMW
ncbi:uncharacterized protein LOC144905801 [Branchiostoma floridae x Branchiostoma belcheri]